MEYALGLIQAAQTALHTTLHQKTETEFAGPCPKCGGTDRFIVFLDGKPRYWCRGCKYSGFLDALLSLTEEDKAKFNEDSRLLTIERAKLQEAALVAMSGCTDHLTYYAELLKRPDKIAYWTSEGISMQSIHQYKLGWCSRCVTDLEERASFTIPVFRDNKLIDIQHRLEGAQAGDKYRLHRKNLPKKPLYNSDLAQSVSTGVVVEGAKKAIVIGQLGFNTVAIFGKESFDASTFETIRHWDPLYIALDPDAMSSSVMIAKLLGPHSRVVKTVLKIDDFVAKHGAGKHDILTLLKYSRRI